MNIQAIALVVTASIAVTFCIEVEFKDCGSKVGNPLHVYVNPCDHVPCIFHKEESGTISIDFIPSGNITSVKAVVHGIILGTELPFPITGDDGCQKSGFTCPLKKDVKVQYFKKLYVRKIYPELKLLVKWELQDQNNEDIVCIVIAAQIE